MDLEFRTPSSGPEGVLELMTIKTYRSPKETIPLLLKLEETAKGGWFLGNGK